MRREMMAAGVAGVLLVSTDVRAETWSFDKDTVDKPPAGFAFGRTGKGKKGRWVVRAEADAPSGPNVLVQVDDDKTGYRFPVAVVRRSKLRDVRLSVKCKPISGKVDQACGLVFRFLNAKNYYVVRANVLENNIRLYHVKKGHRHKFGTFNGEITGKVWHELKVEAKGSHFEVFWDGNKVLEADDKTLRRAGKVGLWTKADTVTYYDDLTAEDLGDTK